MIELELLGRGVNGPLSRDLEEHAQVVPFDRAATHPRLSITRLPKWAQHGAKKRL
jgi:hypothetical protein